MKISKLNNNHVKAKIALKVTPEEIMMASLSKKNQLVDQDGKTYFSLIVNELENCISSKMVVCDYKNKKRNINTEIALASYEGTVVENAELALINDNLNKVVKQIRKEITRLNKLAESIVIEDDSADDVEEVEVAE